MMPIMKKIMSTTTYDDSMYSLSTPLYNLVVEELEYYTEYLKSLYRQDENNEDSTTIRWTIDEHSFVVLMFDFGIEQNEARLHKYTDNVLVEIRQLSRITLTLQLGEMGVPNQYKLIR
jgi:hypothetical protein